MHTRTKALGITIRVKEEVADRDSFEGYPCCILCGTPAPPYNRLAFSCCHYVSRGQGGKGIEENILTLCPDCHRRYDQTTDRAMLKPFFGRYLKEHYPDWDEENLYYKKGE
jgi:5-methylcytosine-specific restriction endonuclease McrA